jgi:DNA invertase Pin-like site-specific DNA recombinase
MLQHVTAHHLTRLACLYVRQSTLQQVFENTESTSRQYALRERALALGWTDERIVVIDQDLGHSAASTADRLGFQQLVAWVGLGQVGLVLGLEVSRLARNSSDWHHLLEICALTQTLILDEEGLYDPSTFNDRLLLGLKGAMSEAELFVMRARLQGGILNKARRGALKLTLPIGLCYTEGDAIVLDPDRAACKLPFVRSFAVFTTRGRPSRPFATFTENISFFRDAFGVGHIKEKLCGESCSTMMCCGSCTSLPMQVPMSLAARARPSLPMERSTFRSYLGPNGIPL